MRSALWANAVELSQQGLTNKQIAVLLGSTQNSVKVMLYRARRLRGVETGHITNHEAYVINHDAGLTVRHKGRSRRDNGPLVIADDGSPSGE